MPDHFTLTVYRRTAHFGENENQERAATAAVLRDAANVIASGQPMRPLKDANGLEVAEISFGPGMIVGGARGAEHLEGTRPDIDRTHMSMPPDTCLTNFGSRPVKRLAPEADTANGRIVQSGEFPKGPPAPWAHNSDFV